MHAIRMSTARLLTVYRSIRGGGVSAKGGSAQGGVCLRGVYPGVSALGVCIPACNGADTPVNRVADRCKNITLPQTSFAGGKNN